jgi:hypothetical protein
MRVQFTYNQEDMVDANLRLLRRSRSSRYWRWQGTIFVTLFFWLAIYVVFVSFLRVFYLAIIEFAIITIVIVVGYPTFYERAIKKRLRRYAREAFGEKNDFVCAVELTPEEIRVRGENTQTAYDWKDVKEIVVTDDSVDIFPQSGGVVVRNRAFDPARQREEFITLARSYLAASHDDTARNQK